MSKPDYIRNTRPMLHVQVPMRDGVQLATNVMLPAAAGSYPVVLVRTAYNRMMPGEDFTSRGIVFVSQDCRGRYGSGGHFYPWVHETQDGEDTLRWIVDQPWCNGKIGMFGDSYLGGVQLALVDTEQPALAALNPRFICGDPWRQAFYSNGAFSLALVFSWLGLECSGRTSAAALLPLFDVPQLLRHQPFLELDEAIGTGILGPWRDFARHTARDAYWQDLDWTHHLPDAKRPLLITGGWYDYYAGETFRMYEALQQGDPALRSQHRVLVGPWSHGVHGQTTYGHMDLGPAAVAEDGHTLRWLEVMLKGGTPADFQAAPIRVFTLGANQWQDFTEWPPADAEWQQWYLHSEGRLTREAPADEGSDEFSYDPADPVLTYGGNHSVGPYNPGLYEHALPGPYDQSVTEARDDVLVYTSGSLETDMEVTGPLHLQLWAQTDGPDTDWVARLCDVDPAGRSLNITEGVLRARFRDGQWENPRLLEPGKSYEYRVDLMDTSHRFLRGHRLRLQITSSNFPLWDRNLNTGGDYPLEVGGRVARQRIWHDAERPTHLMLPVRNPV